MPQTVADRLGDGLRLLVDLLEHERLEARLLRALVVPVERHRLVVDRRAVGGVEEPRSRRHDLDDLAVTRELHDPRLAEEGGGVRRDEHLVLAEAHHHGHLQARAHQLPGVVAVDGDEREVALELEVGTTDGLDEVALVRVLDQVGDGLGIGLGCEHVPFRRQPLTQLAVVLDDPVEHHGQLRRVLARERVRVELGHATVRRPASVTETRGGRGAAEPLGRALEVVERPDRPGVGESALLEQRDPGRVVAAILQPLEPVEQERLALPRPDVSDDPAHRVVSLVGQRSGARKALSCRAIV